MKNSLHTGSKSRNALIVVFALFMGFSTWQCGTGKRRLQKGDYDAAVLQAVKRLRSNPDNRKARNTLVVAYEYAEDFHMKQVKRLQESNAQFRYDGIVTHYEQMNRLYEEINRCPACLELIYKPKYFQTELDDARLAASKAHFNQGVLDLEKGDIQSARNAFRHFESAKQYTPEYDRIDEYLNRALEAATLHVLVDDIPLHSRSLALSNEFFQNRIMQTVRSFNYRFVQFHSTADVAQFNIEPDEVVLLRFDDFVIGQTFLKETQVVRTRDSVVTGYVEVEGEKIPVYGTARATVNTFHKSVTSSGLLDFQIINARSGQTLKQNKMPGTFIWEWDWASFNGQDEALLPADRELIKRREAFPPPPQQLFVEFTQPIFNQIVDQMRRYYRVHN